MMDGVVRAAGAAGFGAGAERLGDDPADGAGAAAALGAAAKAAIDLAGGTRRHRAGVADDTTDVMIGQNVAGTDNHRADRSPGKNVGLLVGHAAVRMQKEKPRF